MDIGENPEHNVEVKRSPPPPPIRTDKELKDSAPEGWIAFREGNVLQAPPAMYCPDKESIPFPCVRDSILLQGGLDEAIPKVKCELPKRALFDYLMSGQSVLQAISLAVLVNIAEQHATAQATGGEQTSVDIFSLALFMLGGVFCEVLFMLGVMITVDKYVKESFFYGCLRQGIVLDFENLSGFFNVGSSCSAVIALLACILIFRGVHNAGGTGTSYIAGTFVVVSLSYNALKFALPWRERDTVEESLIALPKFMESDPNTARKLLSTCKVQSESVTVARISDIINIQRMARAVAVQEYITRNKIELQEMEMKRLVSENFLIVSKKTWFKPYSSSRSLNDLIHGKHPVVNWIERVKHKGNKTAAKADVTAFYEEIYNAGSKFAFAWNQVYTHLPEDEDHILSIGNPLMTGPFPSIAKDGSIMKDPEASRKPKSIFGSLSGRPIFSAVDPEQFMVGKWMCAFDQLHFADEKLEAYSCRITEEALVAYTIAGIIFMFTGLFAMAQIIQAGSSSS